jgi:hypothetical protein
MYDNINEKNMILDDIFKKKYIMYKKKYLNLKNMYGGNPSIETFNTVVDYCIDIFRKKYTTFNSGVPSINFCEYTGMLKPQAEAHTPLPPDWKEHCEEYSDIKNKAGEIIGKLWISSKPNPISAESIMIDDDFICRLRSHEITVEFNYSENAKIIFINFFKSVTQDKLPQTNYIYEPKGKPAYAYSSSTSTSSSYTIDDSKSKEEYAHNIFKEPSADSPYRIISRIFTTKLVDGWIGYGTQDKFNLTLRDYDFSRKVPLRIIIVPV